MAKKIDAIDQRILDILSRHARTSFSDIARKLRKSRTAIVARITRMEEEGIILGYGIVLASDTPAFSRSEAYLVVKHTGGSDCAEIWRQISHFKNILEGHSLFGGIDLLVRVWYVQLDELMDIKSQISMHPKVSEVSIHPVLKTWLPAAGKIAPASD
jgi:DNA-binding Lrp family transcriptional regulator